MAIIDCIARPFGIARLGKSDQDSSDYNEDGDDGDDDDAEYKVHDHRRFRVVRLGKQGW